MYKWNPNHSYIDLRQSLQENMALTATQLNICPVDHPISRLPSGYVKIAIENGHWNSGFTHEKWLFSIAMLIYQRVVGAVTSPSLGHPSSCCLKYCAIWLLKKSSFRWHPMCFLSKLSKKCLSIGIQVLFSLHSCCCKSNLVQIPAYSTIVA